MSGAAPLSFYIHIPYCVKRCGYCDFNTYTPSELKVGGTLAEVSGDYIDLLLREVEQAAREIPSALPVPTIFFGGGTPTLMEPADLGRVLNAIEGTFGFAPDIEITIEANPDTVTVEKLQALRQIGINRISFGMQSAVPHVLQVLDRTHNPENVAKATQWAREAGFEHVSVDLIYGIPGESIADWQTSIDTALSLPIDHISAYALIVETGTKLANQVKRGEVVMPDDDETADKYLLADSRFRAAGFDWYELSNWSRTGGECRHNVAYWLGANWWGLGPGAHSHVDGKRWWNVKHPTAYRDRMIANTSPAHDSEILSDEEKESERVMLAIRMPAGIKRETLDDPTHARLAPYVTSGALDESAWQAGSVVLTASGRLIADRIVREILL
jgi:oxygen-independent coproporphyrinogen-3 oxidase